MSRERRTEAPERWQEILQHEWDRLIDEARKLPPMTPEQREEQAASFAYGQLACMKKYTNATPEELEKLRALCRDAAKKRRFG